MMASSPTNHEDGIYKSPLPLAGEGWGEAEGGPLASGYNVYCFPLTAAFPASAPSHSDIFIDDGVPQGGRSGQRATFGSSGIPLMAGKIACTPSPAGGRGRGEGGVDIWIFPSLPLCGISRLRDPAVLVLCCGAGPYSLIYAKRPILLCIKI
jgi:hypothetical protein